MDTFEQANQKVHLVEDQWHYPIAQGYGFESITKEATGLVRRYAYRHHDRDLTLICTTGAHCDYWQCGDFSGYWRELESTLKEMTAG